MNLKRLENFKRALDSLDSFVITPILTPRDLAGSVYGFVMAFDLAWKCAQDKIIEIGFPDRGPKPVLTAAFKAGLISPQDEPVWSQMLNDRNLSAHVYDEEMARVIVARISQTHLKAMQSLLNKLEQ